MDQELFYPTKKEIAKDKIGFGCLLELLGIALIIFTFFTVIGPIAGFIILLYGFSIARQKRYVCRNCGNELNKESKLCPACGAKYKR